MLCKLFGSVVNSCTFYNSILLGKVAEKSRIEEIRILRPLTFRMFISFNMREKGRKMKLAEDRIKTSKTKQHYGIPLHKVLRIQKFYMCRRGDWTSNWKRNVLSVIRQITSESENLLSWKYLGKYNSSYCYTSLCISLWSIVEKVLDWMDALFAPNWPLYIPASSLSL